MPILPDRMVGPGRILLVFLKASGIIDIPVWRTYLDPATAGTRVSITDKAGHLPDILVDEDGTKIPQQFGWADPPDAGGGPTHGSVLAKVRGLEECTNYIVGYRGQVYTFPEVMGKIHGVHL